MIEEQVVNRLPREHIKVGNIIWYSGSTSQWSWSCPAEIVEILTENYKNGDPRPVFRVRSLDDCKIQNQTYDFDVGLWTPESRKNMYVPTSEEMDLWFATEASFRAVSMRVVKNHVPANTEIYVVEFEGREHPIHDWILNRWCERNTKHRNWMLHGQPLGRAFIDMDEAALCRLKFSGNVTWSSIIS